MFKTSCGLLCTLLAIGRDLSHSVDDVEGYRSLDPVRFWNADSLCLSRSNAHDAGDMSIREHELRLLEYLVNRVVAAHTAIYELFFIDNDALEERRSSRSSGSGFPYHAVGRLIFGGLVSAEKTGLPGVHVQCRHSYDKAEICQLYNTENDGRSPTFYILCHRVPYPAYAHPLAQSPPSRCPL